MAMGGYSSFIVSCQAQAIAIIKANETEIYMMEEAETTVWSLQPAGEDERQSHNHSAAISEQGGRGIYSCRTEL